MVHTLFKSLFIFIFLSGCATIPRLSKELDTAAKTFETTTDKANIYIVRDEFIGAAVGMPLDINGKLLGKTSALTYILATVTPGTQNIISHAEKTAPYLWTSNQEKIILSGKKSKWDSSWLELNYIQ